MLSRRDFLVVSGLVGAGKSLRPVLGRRGGQGSGRDYFTWHPHGEGVWIVSGGGGTSLVVSSAGESLLVDCKGYGLGATLRREVEADGSTLVAAVNTHHHAAQSGGNVAFTPDVPLIAHGRAGRRIVSAVEGVLEALQEDPEEILARRREQIIAMAATPEGARTAASDFDAHVAGVDLIIPGNFGPTETFDDRHTFRVGELEVELHHFGRGHTDNDLIVWIPALDLMHVGNLLYIDAHPLIDVPGGADTRSWQSCLRRIGELADAETSLVLSDRDLIGAMPDLDTMSAYFDDVRGLVERALAAGMSRQETVDFIPSTSLGRFAALDGQDRLAINLGIVYDEMTY